jgi:5-methylthioribose kinase
MTTTGSYYLLDCTSVRRFAQTHLNSNFVDAVEIGTGNSKQLFRVTRGDGTSVLVKQVLPSLHETSDISPALLENIQTEARILQIHYNLCPNFVPRPYHHEHGMGAIIMENLHGYTPLQQTLVERQTLPNLGRHLGLFCAHSLFKTTDMWLNPREKKPMVAEFINPEMRILLEDALYVEPFKIGRGNVVEPELQSEVFALGRDPKVHSAVAQLLHEYRTSAEALLHGELHGGSILVTPETTKIINPKFGFYGPLGFDLAMVLATFVVSTHCHRLQGDTDYSQWVADTGTIFWQTFVREISKLWPTTEQWYNPFMGRLLRSMAGHCGVKLIHDVLGNRPAPEIAAIPDETTRIVVKRTLLSIGRQLIVGAPYLESFENVWNVLLRSGARSPMQYYPVATD